MNKSKLSNSKIFAKTLGIMGKRCPIYLIAIFFMSTGWAFFSVMSSLLVKNVVDAASTGNAEKILVILIGNIIGGVGAMLVYRAAAITYNVEAKRAYSVLSKKLFEQEISLPYEYYEQHHSGELMSKISYDAEKTGAIYGSRFRRTVAPILMVIVYVIPMLILSPHIAVCLIAVNVLLLLINTVFIKPMKNVSSQLSAINSKMTEKLSNLLAGMEQARMYKSGKETVNEFLEENIKYKKRSGKKVMYRAILESTIDGFNLLCGLAFLALGVYFVDKGLTTLGSLAAIYAMYTNFSRQFMQLGYYIPELISHFANAGNVLEFMDLDREPKGWYVNNDKAESGAGNCIELENVCFNYSEESTLLDNFNMSVKEGESVAITGPSGCGKTTISKLILSLYPIKGGDIRVRGKSYKDMSNSEIRSLISYVPQEPYLFQESIMENIRHGKPEASDEEVIEAAKLANAHDFIVDLPEGYNTYVGERGNRLSGGQRQRVAIARAILKDSAVILMDEATSALDNESEELVNEALKGLKKNRTVIMIAHRPSTIALADRVISMG